MIFQPLLRRRVVEIEVQPDKTVAGRQRLVGLANLLRVQARRRLTGTKRMAVDQPGHFIIEIQLVHLFR